MSENENNFVHFLKRLTNKKAGLPTSLYSKNLNYKDGAQLPFYIDTKDYSELLIMQTDGRWDLIRCLKG